MELVSLLDKCLHCYVQASMPEDVERELGC